MATMYEKKPNVITQQGLSKRTFYKRHETQPSLKCQNCTSVDTSVEKILKKKEFKTD
jgi:hypothetical protein